MRTPRAQGEAARSSRAPPDLHPFHDVGTTMSDDDNQSSNGADSPPHTPPPSLPSSPTPRSRARIAQNVVHISVHATTAHVTVNSGQPDRAPRSVPSTPQPALAGGASSVPSSPNRSRTIAPENALPQTPRSIRSEDWDATLEPSLATRPQTPRTANDTGDRADQVPSLRHGGHLGVRSPGGLAERNRLIREALEQHRFGRAPPAGSASPVAAQSRPAAESSSTMTSPSSAPSATGTRAPIRSAEASAGSVGTEAPAYTEVEPGKEHIEAPDRRYRGNWYVVTSGTRVGVFRDFPEVQWYTNGVSGSFQQSVPTRDAAVRRYEDLKRRGLVTVLPE